MGNYPTLFAQPGWYTTRFVAARLGKSWRTIVYWCQSGLFAKRGCVIILVPNSSRIWRGNSSTHRWRGSQYWIYIPLDSKDAMLNKVKLDNLSTSMSTSLQAQQL